MSKKPVRPLGMTRSNAPVPFLNPFTERFTRDGENRKLVSALQHVKPAVDNRSPAQYPHLQDNKKREWLSDMKYAKIERENALLLERLCLIARPRSQAIKPKTFTPGIALDHHLRPVIDNVESDLRVPGNSVNAVTKKLEHARIMSDNQQILQRICKSKGQYSAHQWQQEGQQQRKYAEIRRRVQPSHSRPATSLGMSRAACMTAKPEQIYQVKPRPATAVVNIHTQAQYGSLEVLKEIPRPISALAARSVAAA